MTEDEALAWECVKLAQFTNMSYLETKELPADEFILLKKLAQIDSYTKNQEGMEILKLNARLRQTNPDVNKLRSKFNKEGGN